jgi:hypothetical protein
MNEHVILWLKRRYNALHDDLRILATKPKYGGIRCSRKRLDLQFQMIKEMEYQLNMEVGMRILG